MLSRLSRSISSVLLLPSPVSSLTAHVQLTMAVYSSSHILSFVVTFLRPTKELIAKDEGFVKLAEERGWKSERVVRQTDAGVRLIRLVTEVRP